MIGFFLPAFHQSIRKSVKLQPKFYLFDLGIKRALASELRSNLLPRTSAYGFAFEHFFIAELFRMNSYTRSDYSLFHYQTSSGGEIDLVLKRGKEIVAIEIKLSDHPDMIEVAKLKKTAEDIKAQKVFYASQDQRAAEINGVQCIHWSQLLKILFNSNLRLKD